MMPQDLVQSDSTNSRTGPVAYCRDLTLDKRIKYIRDYLLAKVWYIAQIYPPPDNRVRQLNTSISGSYVKGTSSVSKCPSSTGGRRREVGT